YQRRHLVHTVRSVGLGTAGVMAGVPVAMTAMAAVATVAPPLPPGTGLAVYVAWTYALFAASSQPERVAALLARGRTGAREAWTAVRDTVRPARMVPSGRVLQWTQAQEGGGPIPLTRSHLRGARIVPAGGERFAVHLPVMDLRLDGWHADALAGRLALRLNRHGGDARDVAAALRSIQTFGGPAGYLDRLSGREMEIGPGAPRMGIQALALEMALHEETERRAMDGELAALREMWRQAEEIAAIADALPVVPAPDPPRL
ncbi:MAG TPA: hypothetical protein VK358_17100, partial [Longimicrobium sp.]|nr:hypothetical protein [Longimicrobium sp.]